MSHNPNRRHVEKEQAHKYDFAKAAAAVTIVLGLAFAIAEGVQALDEHNKTQQAFSTLENSEPT